MITWDLPVGPTIARTTHRHTPGTSVQIVIQAPAVAQAARRRAVHPGAVGVR
ncbi:hypothetical protein ACFWZ7_07840 [Nocardiopsis alba]|uniref:hypothetical protein n=1 Tax=Nocardiopsis alba TaxID=53437 RepID=UPI00366CD015